MGAARATRLRSRPHPAAAVPASRRRSRALASAAGALALAAGTLAGCGRKEPADGGLTFETVTDSTTISTGRPLHAQFEPYRDPEGMLRVRGQIDLPDSTRMQITLRRATGGQPLIVVQTVVAGGALDSGPIPIHGLPAPHDQYSFEITSQFSGYWQPEGVLLATRNGFDLRGPGMRRGLHGEAIYTTTLEKRL